MSIDPDEIQEQRIVIHRSHDGFTLIEIAIALGICAFVLVALTGLLQSSISTHLESSNESLAVNLSGLIIRDMRQGKGSPTANSVVSPIFSLPLGAGKTGSLYLSDYGRLLETALDGDARFRVITKISNDGRRVHLAFYAAHGNSPVPVLEVVTYLKDYGKM